MQDWGRLDAAFATLGGISFGIGLLLVLAERRTRTSLGLGGVYLLAGLAFPAATALAGAVARDDPGLLPRLAPLLEAGAVASAAFYLDGLLASSRAGPTAQRRIRVVIRAGVGLAVWLAVIGATFPAARFDDYQGRLLVPSAWDRPGFWLFLVSHLALAAVFMTGYLLLVRERLDRGEHRRAACALVGSPLLIATMVLPQAAGLVSGTASMLVVLYGQFQYAVAQGERGAFLSRFLSPQVASLVRNGGLDSLMRPCELDLSVVCCDLRGFTAYAEAVPSQAVIDLLAEYYEAVGSVVARHGGTIKDYAGDGVLILVGAPLPRDDHASVALRLADELHVAVAPALDHWATPVHPLGLGVGVASGRVTVGAIGPSERMDYTAVGTPVNLASRLCSAAEAGQVLLDESTAHAAGAHGLAPVGPQQIKGLRGTRHVFRSAPTTPAGPEAAV